MNKFVRVLPESFDMRYRGLDKAKLLECLKREPRALKRGERPKSGKVKC